MSSRAEDFTDTIPASDAEILAELAPCLQLVAPAGMSTEAQDTWFEAALKALDGMPIGLVQRGCRTAMLKADHPSKIVRAIMDEVGDALRWRRDNAARSRPAPLLVAPPTPPIPNDETQRIIREAGLRMSDTSDLSRPAPISGSSDRPARMPTRADYIRMGVDPAVLDGLA